MQEQDVEPGVVAGVQHGPPSARHAAKHEVNPVDGVELVQHQIKVLMAAQALVSAPFIDVSPDVNGHCVRLKRLPMVIHERSLQSMAAATAVRSGGNR